MIKIADTSFNKLVDERLDEITELDKKVNYDDLIYRYKGKTPDEKFDKYDNALNVIDKTKKGEIKGQYNYKNGYYIYELRK